MLRKVSEFAAERLGGLGAQAVRLVHSIALRLWESAPELSQLLSTRPSRVRHYVNLAPKDFERLIEKRKSIGKTGKVCKVF